MELSIIVPVYNVEKYLSKCIESILSQTFTDFELILIDDGSPDNCGKIIDSYAEKDSRIVAIHQKNKGVSAARNAGLRIAKGKYIGFVDPDDYIDADMYSKMIALAKKNGSEIVCCGVSDVDEYGKVSSHKIDLPEIMNRTDFLYHLYDVPRSLGGAVWNKVFLREKIYIEFDEDYSVGEDWLFLVKICMKCSTFSVVGDALYNYLLRTNSATNTPSFKSIMRIKANRKTMNELNGMPAKVINVAEANYLDACIVLLGELLNNYNEKTQNDLNVMYCDYVREHFFHIIFNKNIFWKTRLLYIKKYLRFK